MNGNTQNLSRAIEKSRNLVTVVFTDIVDSTKFWDKHGDTAGRLMLDRHNTLLFPVVETFKGTIIKTIGDSIMASFKTPKAAVKAAIAMQQQLALTRQADKSFQVHIRIGVHTGKALVEASDVFGDTVNVAARVESAASGDEILVSDATARRLKNKKTEFGLMHKRTFVPKGKKRRLTVWVCEWTSVRNLTVGIRRSRVFPPNRRQRVEIGVYLLVALATVWLLFQEFLRYVLSDNVWLAPWLAPPHATLKWWLLGVGVLLTVILLRRLARVTKPPVRLFGFLKAGCFFGVFFFASLWSAEAVDPDIKQYWNGPLYRTKHQFVEIIADDVVIRKKPMRSAPVITTATKNDLYVFKRQVNKKRRSFINVAIQHDTQSHGFILTEQPPKIGVPAVPQTETQRLIIRYYHLYAFFLGLMGFLFGAWSFRLKPL